MVVNRFIASLTYSTDTDEWIQQPIYENSITRQQDLEISNPVRVCLIMYLRTLGNVLLDCTKPTSSRREKTDLHIWREIFSLYENSAIFCPTRECTCLTESDIVVQRQVRFFSTLGT